MCTENSPDVRERHSYKSDSVTSGSSLPPKAWIGQDSTTGSDSSSVRTQTQVDSSRRDGSVAQSGPFGDLRRDAARPVKQRRQPIVVEVFDRGQSAPEDVVARRRRRPKRVAKANPTRLGTRTVCEQGAEAVAEEHVWPVERRSGVGVVLDLAASARCSVANRPRFPISTGVTSTRGPGALFQPLNIAGATAGAMEARQLTPFIKSSSKRLQRR